MNTMYEAGLKYTSVIRPYCLWRYWTDHPEMKNNTIFYCDCDVLFLPNFNIDKFIEDDVNYMSDTRGYINASYFDRKVKDVLPNKLKEYNKRDILNETAKMVGIDRKICELNNENSGGAQYILKNVNGEFWRKVTDDCVKIKLHLSNVNKKFFENENKGFQSFCADMWAILWNLWYNKRETRIVPELNFAWATDPVEKLQECTIYHNAGICADFTDGHPSFFKGKYHRMGDPLRDAHLETILNNEESKKWCTWYYASKLKELSNKLLTI
jgi:hypothetical protein